jgi:hypothetical protein
MYTCDKCGGSSTASHFCENPACPLMPCCMQEEENCTCSYDALKTFNKEELQKILETAVINEKESFFIEGQCVITTYDALMLCESNNKNIISLN